MWISRVLFYTKISILFEPPRAVWRFYIMMRIITGTARGVRLETLEGNDTTRPTGEKVKEAIFSMIQFEIEGRKVLDVFSGSGQLALEALSRGADNATMIEASKDAAAIIRRNAVKTKMISNSKVIVSDYKTALRGLEGQKFQLVFMDPPYAASLFPIRLTELSVTVFLPTAVLWFVRARTQLPTSIPHLSSASITSTEDLLLLYMRKR